MNFRHVDLTVNSGDNNFVIRVRNARHEDGRRIQMLFAEVYGHNYPMSLVSDRAKMNHAISSDEYFWLVGEHNGRIIASQIMHLDLKNRLAKAIGAVVSREYRKHKLNNIMMNLIMDSVTRKRKLVDAVYATTRTVTAAPQKVLDNLGFSALGIFPNAHKIHEHETYCLTAYYVLSAWGKRRKPVKMVREIEPFFRLAQRELLSRLPNKELQLGAARFVAEKSPDAGQPNRADQKLIQFEMVNAPSFVAERFRRTGNSGVFSNFYVPFHKPNMMLVSHDQKTEVYLQYNPQDKYTAILGGRSEIQDLSLLLNSVADVVSNLNISYLECLVDAYTPELQRQAIDAGFLPSAYFPAMRLVGRRRWDYIAFSRSFETLDFRKVSLIPTYRAYLREYIKMWNAMYVETALRSGK
ncbi:MAG TPA: hypothetical protein PK523_04470 [Elusimicrobiales bacterium]|nr:hypothetical protein [Elusimicrobiales bacterium]